MAAFHRRTVDTDESRYPFCRCASASGATHNAFHVLVGERTPMGRPGLRDRSTRPGGTGPVSRFSPVTIQTPSKPRFILSRIVGIEIDVQTGYSAISKFENR